MTFYILWSKIYFNYINIWNIFMQRPLCHNWNSKNLSTSKIHFSEANFFHVITSEDFWFFPKNKEWDIKNASSHENYGDIITTYQKEQQIKKIIQELEADIDQYLQNFPNTSQNEIQILKYAYILSQLSHRWQDRKTGDRQYFEHPLRISYAAYQVWLGIDAIVGALLHDVIEDTTMTKEMIIKIFWEHIGVIVQNLTATHWTTYLIQTHDRRNSINKEEYSSKDKRNPQNQKKVNLFLRAYDVLESAKKTGFPENNQTILEKEYQEAITHIPLPIKRALQKRSDKEYYQYMWDISSTLKVLDRIDFFLTINNQWTDEKIIAKIQNTIEFILPLEEIQEKKFHNESDKVLIRYLSIELIELMNNIIIQRKLNINIISYADKIQDAIWEQVLNIIWYISKEKSEIKSIVQYFKELIEHKICNRKISADGIVQAA